MKKWYYEKNTELIQSHVNKTFDEVLVMSEEEFRAWVIDLRKVVVQLWDEKGQPPRVGYNTDEIIAQFQELEPFRVNKFIERDEVTGNKDVIRNTSVLGNAVNQFFPTMMKTRINYSKDVDAGRSIYDFFAQDELLDTFLTYARRHFKRDSFYHYSNPVKVLDQSQHPHLPVSDSAEEWILSFERDKYRRRGKWDYWLAPREEETEYTGYNETIRAQKHLRINRETIERLGKKIPVHCRTNIDWERSESYLIRVYEPGQKLFPVGLKAFRVSFCQYAVNFPPLTAKFIYERYTEEWKNEPNIFVWDPSAGWGGRLVGALSTDDERHLVYLANDPNTDHNTTEGRTKYHEVADFYRDNIYRGLFALPHNDFYFWQKGSEEMQYDMAFQQYRGKLSLVFTSPPYFAKEAYSQDPEQSYKKFSHYESWREGFLKPTLKTAVEWLRPGGYLAWNIADAVFAGEMLPLEKDSTDYLESLGMEHKTTWKMSLAQMPGGNRLDPDTGLPKAKNTCKVNGLWLKYEPIFVFRKS